MPARPRPPTEPEARAARLSRLPGVSLGAASAASGVPLSALRRARAALGLAAYPSRADLVLAALTGSGARAEGPVPELGHVAAFLDWANHDGSTAEEVASLLDALIAEGALAVSEGRFRLLRPWP